MTSLLCASDFCRRAFNPSTVRLKIVPTAVQDDDVTATAAHHETIARAHAPWNLFRRLALFDESLVWLKCNNNSNESTRLVVELCMMKEDPEALSKAEQPDNDDEHATTLLITSLTAINLRQSFDFQSSFLNHHQTIAATIHPFTGTTRRAHKVTLRPWGAPFLAPPLIKNIKDTSNTNNNNNQSVRKSSSSKLLPLTGTTVQPGKLICVSNDKENLNENTGSSSTSIYPAAAYHDAQQYYEVVQVKGDDEISQSYPSIPPIMDAVFVTHAHTEFRFETIQFPSTCPQLPSCLFPYPPSSNNIDNNIGSIPPHPNLPDLVEAFHTILPNASPAERIFTLLGSANEHDVSLAVTTAAALVGRSCLTVRGLAAHAYRTAGQLQRAASLVDKLQGLDAALEQAYQAAPSVLLIEDVDQEFTANDDRLRCDEEGRIWSLCTNALGEAVMNHDANNSVDGNTITRIPSVLVVFSMSKLPPKGPLVEHLVWEPVSLALPDEAYSQYLWQEVSQKLPWTKEWYDQLEGRTVLEIRQLAREVADEMEFSNKNDYSLENIQLVFADKLASMMQSGRLESQTKIPKVKWSDVGGLEHVRREIMETIEWPLKHAELFTTHGRSGILLYGPPGTGKTLVAKAVANECGLPFLSVKGPELLGSFVGESESNVRAVFAQARTLAQRNVPQKAAIVFFDELDSLAPRRGEQASGGASVMDRVVATFFTELDRSTQDCMVFCIGATNRPDMLDPALLRPGRLDRMVYLGLSDLDRAQILKVHLSKLKLEPGVSAEDLAGKAADRLNANLTGADLASVASGALMLATQRLCDQAEEELIEAQTKPKGGNFSIDHILSHWKPEDLEPTVRLQDLLTAASNVSPSVDEEQLAQYEQLREKLESDWKCRKP